MNRFDDAPRICRHPPTRVEGFAGAPDALTAVPPGVSFGHVLTEAAP